LTLDSAAVDAIDVMLQAQPAFIASLPELIG
jgi:hypothetical protein